MKTLAEIYRINGPAVISFSGGRTSAYMLHEIVKAWDGALPGDVKVVFANTGKEREETLRFVYECGSRWGVNIHWLEWRDGNLFEEVGFNSASRKGEPFERLMAKKKWVPTAPQRFCTQELKVLTVSRFALSLGWSEWKNVIGLRYDEGRRIFKALEKNDKGADPWINVMPLSKAKVTKADIKAFWLAQPFDLGLLPYESNCDLCFMKNKQVLKALIRENPGMADWWIDQEKRHTRQFDVGFSFSDLVSNVEDQPLLPFDDEHDSECGLTCGGEQ